MSNQLAPLIIILGPTGSGKSELAINLARLFSGEIICADSRTIYRQMNIGTAKPYLNKKNVRHYQTKVFIDSIPHHLLDVANPDQKFTVGQYKQQAIKTIRQIQHKRKLPFLVGGTALYLKTIADNFLIPSIMPDLSFRKEMEEKIKKQGIDHIYQRLIKLDPLAKDFVQANNPRRIIRALEVIEKTGKPFSQLRKRGPALFNILKIGIQIDRQKLYQRIDRRVEQMIKMGLVEEVKQLLKKYPANLSSFSGIGYREITNYLNKEIALPQAIQQIKYATHRYARRQMTWWRQDERINWIDKQSSAIRLIKKFISE
ncbi:MAG: tRNA (adenosine(37)-N6)-dimethylallyltransferase MiaA [Candidatus Aenigmarchaeota archaeon]|nr:tRNA (adenosine(37)-N6)-dimethylallyltransferase MiaA [Candidatus Aenigmarchaeota archaeon]